MKEQQNVITIGAFDGVHKGHALLIKKTIDTAKRKKMKSMVLTLERPVKNVDGLLSSYDEKIELLKEYGTDEISVIAVPSEILKLSPDDFYEKILKKELKAGHIICGKDFAFGKNRAGNALWLKKKAGRDKICVDIVKPLKISAKKISSSRIRALLHKGDIKNAAKLLGRDYSFSGMPFREKAIGTTIGFPTVNLKTDKDKIIPKGVYVSIILQNSVGYPAITNIGKRPTFNRGKNIVPETHILNFNGKWKKAKTEIILLKKIRNEKKFTDSTALKKEIAKDISRAQKFFGFKKEIL